MMLMTIVMFQLQEVWHRQGFFMGMHWAWWLFLIATGLMVLWGFWRLFADRREALRDVDRMRQTEAALRQRYARGEIDQEQLIEGLSALFVPSMPGTAHTPPER